MRFAVSGNISLSSGRFIEDRGSFMKDAILIVFKCRCVCVCNKNVLQPLPSPALHPLSHNVRNLNQSQTDKVVLCRFRLARLHPRVVPRKHYRRKPDISSGSNIFRRTYHPFSHCALHTVSRKRLGNGEARQGKARQGE